MRAAEASSAVVPTAAEQPDGADTEAPSSRSTAAASGDVDVGDSTPAAPEPASGKAGARGAQAAAVAAAIKRAARAADLPQSAVPGGWVKVAGANSFGCDTHLDQGRALGWGPVPTNSQPQAQMHPKVHLEFALWVGGGL